MPSVSSRAQIPRASTSNEWQLWVLHITPNAAYFRSIAAVWVSECEEVFYCGFDWHLSMAIRTCSLEIDLFKSFALFWSWVFLNVGGTDN